MSGGALVPVQTAGNSACVEWLLEQTSGESIAEMAKGGGIMTCKGDAFCPYSDKCPFCNIEDAPDPPKGEPCAVEVVFLDKMVHSYVDEIASGGQINWSLLCLIKDVVMLELQIHRCERALAIGGQVVEMVVVGLDRVSGAEIKKPEVSQVLVAWQKLLREKLRILEQLGLTPKARAQIGSTIYKDPSTYAAETARAFYEIVKRRLREGRKDYGGPSRSTDDTTVDTIALPVPTTGDASASHETGSGADVGSNAAGSADGGSTPCGGQCVRSLSGGAGGEEVSPASGDTGSNISDVDQSESDSNNSHDEHTADRRSAVADAGEIGGVMEEELASDESGSGDAARRDTEEHDRSGSKSVRSKGRGRKVSGGGTRDGEDEATEAGSIQYRGSSPPF